MTPRSDTIILFAMISVAFTNSQFSLNTSTNSVRESEACCSDLTARILDARALASSHADPRTSERSSVMGCDGLGVEEGVDESGTDEDMERVGRQLPSIDFSPARKVKREDEPSLFHDDDKLIADLLSQMQPTQYGTIHLRGQQEEAGVIHRLQRLGETRSSPDTVSGIRSGETSDRTHPLISGCFPSSSISSSACATGRC